MNILLVGLGSIGQRHLRNIISLGYRKISIVTCLGKLPDEFADLNVYVSIEAATTEEKFDAAIICTPTAHHIADLYKLLQHGAKNIYLEKPVSHDYAGISDLIKLATQKNSRVMVGYDLHFDPGLQKIKELMNAEVLGKPISINAVVGQYLPDWRPTQDYTQGVSAKQNLGGGVMLDLIHEFDYVYRLFGSVKTIGAHYARSGSLHIETEDVAEVMLKFDNGALGTIHLDYLQPKLIRRCMITGEKSSIFWDMSINEVSWNNKDKKTFHFSYPGFERNERFKESIKTFLAAENDERLTTLQEGTMSLQMVLAAKKSSEQQLFIELNQFNVE